MSQWSAELELELACKVGSEVDLERAIEEGADVNWDGGAPLFLAILGGHRHLIERLVAEGADPSLFLGKTQLKKLKSETEIVTALCAGCPPPVEDDDEEPPVDSGEDGD